MPTRWRRTAGTDCAAHVLRRGEERVAVRPISTVAIRARLAVAYADTVAADSRDGLYGACPASGRRARRGQAPIHDSYLGAFGCGVCPKERGKSAADGLAQLRGAKAGVSPPSRVRILADGGRRAGRGSRPHSARKGFPRSGALRVLRAECAAKQRKN